MKKNVMKRKSKTILRGARQYLFLNLSVTQQQWCRWRVLYNLNAATGFTPRYANSNNNKHKNKNATFWRLSLLQEKQQITVLCLKI